MYCIFLYLIGIHSDLWIVNKTHLYLRIMLFVRVCMHVRVCVHACTHESVRTHAFCLYVHVYIHVYLCERTRGYIFGADLFLCVCICICICVRTHAWTSLQLFCLYVYVCVYVCEHMRGYIFGAGLLVVILSM